MLPADYAIDFVEVRDCRPSADHDLRNIRVVADPVAAVRYQARQGEFTPGELIVKEEYDFADVACAGPILEWTVMRRTGDTERLGWDWQRIDADRAVVSENEGRCIGCHTDCDAFRGTCADP